MCVQRASIHRPVADTEFSKTHQIVVICALISRVTGVGFEIRHLATGLFLCE